MPEKTLVAEELETADGAVCALGAVGKARGVDMNGVDPEETDKVAKLFNIADALAREVVYENDEGRWGGTETTSQRYWRMRAWVESNIRPQRQTAVIKLRGSK